MGERFFFQYHEKLLLIPSLLIVPGTVEGTEGFCAVHSCCVEQSPGSQAFVDHLLVDHVDLLNRDLPSWVHAHIYATHLLDFLGEKRHHKVRPLGAALSMA